MSNVLRIKPQLWCNKLLVLSVCCCCCCCFFFYNTVQSSLKIKYKASQISLKILEPVLQSVEDIDNKKNFKPI